MLQGRRSLLFSVVGAASVSAGAGAGYFYRSEGDPYAKQLAELDFARQNKTYQRAKGSHKTRQLTSRKQRSLSTSSAASSSGPGDVTMSSSDVELGLEQSMARKMACWISRASVYASTQMFYASASSHLRNQTSSDFVDETSGLATTTSGSDGFRNSDIEFRSSRSHCGRGMIPTSGSGSGNHATPRSRLDLYHEMFGWLSDLVENSSSGAEVEWNVAKILHSSSFDFLLNLIAGIDQAAETLQQQQQNQQLQNRDHLLHYHKAVLSKEIKTQAYRVLNGLAQNPVCARAIAERSTRYGKRTLLNVARYHAQDPRVGFALARMVKEDASDSWYGPANLMSLVALAVAHDMPDEYLQFALWALRKTCSASHEDDTVTSANSDQPRRKLRRAYQLRKTLFGEDVFAKNRAKLCANAKLWHALLDVSDRSEQVQFQAAKLLVEMTREATLVHKLKLTNPEKDATEDEQDSDSGSGSGDELIGLLTEWLQHSKHVPTLCASLDVLANLCGPRRRPGKSRTKTNSITTTKSVEFRARLVDLGLLQLVRQRILQTSAKMHGANLTAQEACRLNAKLLAVVHALASTPATSGGKEEEEEEEEDSLPFGVFGFPLDDDALTFVHDPSVSDSFGFGFHMDDLVDLCDIQQEDPQILDGWIDLFTSFLRPQQTLRHFQHHQQPHDNDGSNQDETGFSVQDPLVGAYDAVRQEAVLCLSTLARHSAYSHEAIQEWLIATLDAVLEQVPASIVNHSTIVREAKTRKRPVTCVTRPGSNNNNLSSSNLQTAATKLSSSRVRASAFEYEACHARAIRALSFVASRPDCQDEFARCGGAALLHVLLRSTNPQVQMETARLMANLLACDHMNDQLYEFLTQNPVALDQLNQWATQPSLTPSPPPPPRPEQPELAEATSTTTTQFPSLKLASFAQRALANQQYQHHQREVTRTGTTDSTSTNWVRYMDDVNLLHCHDVQRNHCDQPTATEAFQKVQKPQEEEYDVDVVFLHGLMGCPFATWMHKRDGILDENHIWPCEWLARDLQQEYGIKARILSIGYDSKILGSESTWRKMCLRETGSEVLAKLEAAQVGQHQAMAKHGTRPVVFVTHSLGGVLLKQILLESSLKQQESSHGSRTTTGSQLAEAAEAEKGLKTPLIPPRESSSSCKVNLVDRVTGVVFYGVPHHGSPIASLVHSLQVGKAFGQHPITEHLHGSPYLKMLNDWCHHAFASRGIEAVSLIEQVPCRLPLIGLEALVVPPELGNPGFGKVQLLNGNHIEVCKPDSKQDLRYAITKEMIVKSVFSHQQQMAEPHDTTPQLQFTSTQDEQEEENVM